MQDLQRYMYRLVQRTILQEISMQTLLSSMCLDYEILSLVLLNWLIFWHDVIKVNPRKTSALLFDRIKTYHKFFHHEYHLRRILEENKFLTRLGSDDLLHMVFT